MADPSTFVDRYRKNCLLRPPSALDATEIERLEAIRKTWGPGYFSYTVRPGEKLSVICSRLASAGKAPRGFDMRFLCRFNWGVEFMPHVIWRMVEAFGCSGQNIGPDKESYVLAGGETLLIPRGKVSSDRAAVRANQPNALALAKVVLLGVSGPSLMTPGIPARFKVTGYSAESVTDDLKASIKWKVKDLDDGNESDASSTGESVELSFAEAKKGHRIQVLPYLDAPNENIRVDLRVVKLEIEHVVDMRHVDDQEVRTTDSVNKVHNPSGIVIGASTEATAARFRVTKSDPAEPDFHLAPNDEGIVWRVRPTEEKEPPPGRARFARVGGILRNRGSECLLDGSKAGYVTLEAWADQATKAFAELTLKVVHEREIPFRVNLLTSKAVGTGPTYSTDATVARVKKMIHAANVILRQAGLKLVPDTSNAAQPIGGGVGQGETITAVNGEQGYFRVTNVPLKYVKVADYSDSETASNINARPGVVNFTFAVSGDEPGDLGLAPSASYNLFSKPQNHGGGFANSVPDGYEGPTESIKVDDTANFETLDLFGTPDTPSGAKDLSGILIYNLGIPSTDDAPSNTELGTTEAHEIGHCAGLQHRNTSDDGQAVDTKNLMHATAEKTADIDLLQLEAYRGWVLSKDDSDGLSIRTPGTSKVSAPNDGEKTFTLEVVRGGKRVPNVRLNFWVKPYQSTVVQIQSVQYWEASTRKAEKGMVRVKVKLKGSTGDEGKVFVLAGENDDLVSAEIDCEVS